MTGNAAYTDIIFEEKDGIATITINRPEKLNAFRGKTCDELIDALNRSAWDVGIGVIVLTGAGTRAFCTGGDQSAHEGGYDGRGTIGLPVETLHGLIRLSIQASAPHILPAWSARRRRVKSGTCAVATTTHRPPYRVGHRARL